MGFTPGNVVPAMFFGQCQRLTHDGNGCYPGLCAQSNIGRTALETQGFSRCGAGALGENNQATASGDGRPRIINQPNRFIIGDKTGEPQITPHKRITEQSLLNNAIRIGNKRH